MGFSHKSSWYSPVCTIAKETVAAVASESFESKGGKINFGGKYKKKCAQSVKICNFNAEIVKYGLILRHIWNYFWENIKICAQKCAKIAIVKLKLSNMDWF